MTVSVVGASGFVGSHVAARLEASGHRVIRLPAPRITSTREGASTAWRNSPALVEALADAVAGSGALVNCAGLPDASAGESPMLFGANAALPGILVAAAEVAHIPRFVHVSSAVVQGGKAVLDTSAPSAAHSPYALSKSLGERTVHAPPQHNTLRVCYRPPSVHAPSRRITRSLFWIANSPLSTVVAPGDRPTPQAHIENVADAIAFLSTTTTPPPSTVVHPYEGWTTASFLTMLASGRPPRRIPEVLATPIDRMLRLAARSPSLAPNARRLHMLWFGQKQAPSWLTEHSWKPPAGPDAWTQMVVALATTRPTSPPKNKDSS
ncbi:nucleoside-diphosphate-sugar epimerase [Ornithinimicrobium humiphilum]|uniref:Nucleoside-diphosphate-sugar epimerase n=1 Tax=Ornithinimicrobium humiphilum TaxID=125288 RepID=A0A543K872_9MICO|nr:nucleoside-diphosphate-sugar epimerase [Ornithinimicrobium humiphilum]